MHSKGYFGRRNALMWANLSFSSLMSSFMEWSILSLTAPTPKGLNIVKNITRTIIKGSCIYIYKLLKSKGKSNFLIIIMPLLYPIKAKKQRNKRLAINLLSYIIVKNII